MSFMQVESASTYGTSLSKRESPAMDPITKAILEIWKDIFSFDGIDRDSDFFDLGGNSLTAGKLQSALKKKFGVVVRTADILRHPIAADLAEKIQSIIKNVRRDELLTSNPDVIPLQPRGEGRAIFVISNSMIFRKLALQLGTDQPVYAILRNDSEPVSNQSSLDEILDFYLQKIRAVQPNGPYRLAGWCVSGWIAYGIARKLEDQGEQIELLTVIDMTAPGYWAQCNIFTKLLYYWHSFKSARKKTPTVQLLLKKLMKVDKTQEEKDDDELEEIASEVRFLGPLRGKMLLFCSQDDPINCLPPGLGWERMLGRSIQAVRLPGSHHGIFENPGAKNMAQWILSELMP